MNWFIAKLVFNINIDKGKNIRQFDEQLRLLFAFDWEDALSKAIKIGKSEEESFYNRNEKKVKWEFVDVIDLKVLEHIDHGVELYSMINEVSEPDDFHKFVKLRSSSLQKKIKEKQLS